jgi:hypothetical protein
MLPMSQAGVDDLDNSEDGSGKWGRVWPGEGPVNGSLLRIGTLDTIECSLANVAGFFKRVS